MMLSGIVIQPSMANPAFANWTEVGPNFFQGLNPTGGLEAMSGQVSSIAVDLVHDPTGNTVYVASASGGIWRSTNGLATFPVFTPISDQNGNLTAGAIALDTRSRPPLIFVGTGDPLNPAIISAHAGTGVLVSRDDGRTWHEVDSADNGTHPFAGLGFSKIIVDPHNSSVLMASAVRASDNVAPGRMETAIPWGSNAYRQVGIYRSTNSGITWTLVKPVPLAGIEVDTDAYFNIDMVYDTARSIYVAGISHLGLFGYSEAAGWRAFADLGLPTAGLPPTASMHRISVTARDGRLWALVMVKQFPRPEDVHTAHQLFELDPGAASWKQLTTPAGLTHKGGLMYVAAPPGSSALVVATEAIFRTDNVDDAELRWTPIEGALHGDQHAIAFVDARTWYVGDDGGLFVTRDGGDHWKSVNATLHTTEFFSAVATAADNGLYVGGQQDNGPCISEGGGNWRQLEGGDGLYAAADPHDPDASFVSANSGAIRYLATATSPPRDLGLSSGDGPLLTPYEVLPNDARLIAGSGAAAQLDLQRARILLIGRHDLWLAGFEPTTTGVVTGQVTSQINDFIHYVAAPPTDATVAYAVTRTRLFRVTRVAFAGGASVAAMLGGPVNGTDPLGPIAISPTNANVIYLIKVGVLAHQKLFKSMDGGRSWVNVSGNLPNIPVHCVTIDPSNGDDIYLGTNVGAFMATDGGVNDERWQRLGIGLPRVPVMQLSVSAKRQLVAATLGRGVWSLDLTSSNNGPPSVCQQLKNRMRELQGELDLLRDEFAHAVGPGKGQIGTQITQHLNEISSIKSEMVVHHCQ